MVIPADNDQAAIEQTENMLDGARAELRDGHATPKQRAGVIFALNGGGKRRSVNAAPGARLAA
jgi:hypothetical protein